MIINLWWYILREHVFFPWNEISPIPCCCWDVNVFRTLSSAFERFRALPNAFERFRALPNAFDFERFRTLLSAFERFPNAFERFWTSPIAFERFQKRLSFGNMFLFPEMKSRLFHVVVEVLTFSERFRARNRPMVHNTMSFVRFMECCHIDEPSIQLNLRLRVGSWLQRRVTHICKT